MDNGHLRRVAYRLRQNNSSFERFHLPLDDLSNVTDFTRALASNSTVKEVSIFCEFLMDESWLSQEVWRLFRTLGRLPKLERIVWDFIGSDGDKLPVSLLAATIRNASKLQVLELSCVHLTGSLDDFQTFSQALRQKPKLQKLHIYACYLSEEYRDSSRYILGPVLEEMARLPNLQDALITALDFNSLGRLSSESLGNLLHLSPKLRNLVLGEFALDDQHLVAMSVALENKRTLKELSFGCELGAPGAEALCNILRSNSNVSSLETLHVHLAYLDGGEGHHVSIANALRENDVLKRFSLFGSSGNLTNNAFQAFVDMMETNYTLEEVEFQDENESLQPQLDMYLKLNTQGRAKLLKDETSTRQDWINALLELREDLDCVFHLISLNPAILSPEDINLTGRGTKRKLEFSDDEDGDDEDSDDEDSDDEDDDACTSSYSDDDLSS
ncbi:expressed unknown protein [Seminavis robusta]|uniref:Uncharacterized protein n=1 Tax=Seminavis robusta TaxID=568900 RepID=A0A9N8DLM2_9STRA|nr:expressed unknown protein [Seminavis robusta]|eukprot:Sro224_g091540.1 n/a (443) ;mRNA; r:14858-16186